MPLTESLARTPAPILISRFVRLDAGTLARRIARAFGYRRPRNIAIDELRIPDSPAATRALALVEQVSPSFLVNHSIRTFCFGMAIARNLDLRPDTETFFLAAIMHDLGLVEPYDRDGSFEVNGARAARAFLLEQGMERNVADLVHEAIALHSAVGIAAKREPEIALVHYGAGMDVIGFRAEDIAPETRDSIIAAYPRLQFKQEFSVLLDDQVRRKAQCHIAGHHALGFTRKIRNAPFSE